MSFNIALPVNSGGAMFLWLTTDNSFIKNY
jgi:hypothetical protein